MPASLFSRLNCYLTGHDYTVRSSGDQIFLRCDACGHRSTGWSLACDARDQKPHPQVRTSVARKAPDSSRRATA